MRVVVVPGNLSTGAPSDISNLTPQGNDIRYNRHYCNLKIISCLLYIILCTYSARQWHYCWEEERDRGISRSFPTQVSIQKEIYITHELIWYITCCIGRFHLKTAGIHKSYACVSCKEPIKSLQRLVKCSGKTSYVINATSSYIHAHVCTFTSAQIMMSWAILRAYMYMYM